MRNALIYAALCLIWGSTWVAIKIGLDDAPPMWSVAFRFLVAAALLLAYNAINHTKYPAGWKEKWKVAWPGLFTYVGSYSFTYLGTQYIPSALASILFAVFPFFVLLLMPLMIKDERVTLKAILGTVVGFLGIVVIFLEPVEWSENALLGMIFLLLSPLAAALGTVSIKKWLRDEPVIPMITLQMALGSVLLTLMALFFEDITRFQITAKSVGSVVFLAVLGSIFTFAGYYWLLQRVRLVTMSMVALIAPLVAVYMGWLVLGEVLSVRDYIGAALVLSGVAVVTLRRRRKAPAVAMPPTPSGDS